MYTKNITIMLHFCEPNIVYRTKFNNFDQLNSIKWFFIKNSFYSLRKKYTWKKEPYISHEIEQQQKTTKMKNLKMCLNTVYNNAHISFTSTHVSSHIPKPGFFRSSVLSTILFYLIFYLTHFPSNKVHVFSLSLVLLFVYILQRKTRTIEKKRDRWREIEECFFSFISKVHIALKCCFWSWWMWMNT